MCWTISLLLFEISNLFILVQTVHYQNYFHSSNTMYLLQVLTTYLKIVMLRFPNFDFRSISIRFNSSYTHSKSFPTKFRDNRRWAVVFKAIYCLYETCRRLLIDVNLRGTYQQTTHCPWPVTNPPRISHLQMSKWQVTTMFPRSNLIYRGPPISNIPRNLMHDFDNRLNNWLESSNLQIRPPEMNYQFTWR